MGRASYIVRVWLPDRPGALGAVASRIGAVRGDVVGIDILERGGGRAIDELVVELADEQWLPLLLAEIDQVDGVDVEDVRPVADALHDPRLDALETAAQLVGARRECDELLRALCEHARRTVGGEWCAVVDVGADVPALVAGDGPTPDAPWLGAFVRGSSAAGPVAQLEAGPDDVLWAPLAASELALVLGRRGTPFRARERRQAAALARIADTRHRELSIVAARRLHPSSTLVAAAGPVDVPAGWLHPV